MKKNRLTIREQLANLACCYYCLLMMIPAVLVDTLRQKAMIEERERKALELAPESTHA